MFFQPFLEERLSQRTLMKGKFKFVGEGLAPPTLFNAMSQKAFPCEGRGTAKCLRSKLYAERSEASRQSRAKHKEIFINNGRIISSPTDKISKFSPNSVGTGVPDGPKRADMESAPTDLNVVLKFVCRGGYYPPAVYKNSIAFCAGYPP